MTETYIELPLDDILDDLFHGCAVAAFLDQAAVDRGWPDPEATRARAYRYYQSVIDDKNRRSG